MQMSETCRGHLWEKIIVKLFVSSWYIFLTYIYDARSHLHQKGTSIYADKFEGYRQQGSSRVSKHLKKKKLNSPETSRAHYAVT